MSQSWGRLDDGRFHYKRSLASRVILLTTMAVGLVVALVALGAYLTVRMQMQAALDASLLERAKTTADNPALAQLASKVPSAALGANDVRVIYIDANQNWRTLDTGPTLTLGQSELSIAERQSGHSVRTIKAGDTRYRVVTVPAGNGTALVIAQSLETQDTVLGRLGIVMLLLGGAGVIAAGLAGWAVARNGLRPVRRLTLAAEHVARTEDLKPIPIEGTDEIARLAAAFNQMLTALSASRDRQRQLVADAGHELRTPLTSMRTNLDLLLQADAAGGMSPETRAELLDDVRAQMEELTTLIGDLVELGRQEGLTHVVEPVDLAEVVDRAVVRVRRRAPSLEFVVDTDPWWVTGESAALERALINLLDNAAKWSPEGGTVTTRLAGGVLTVCDQGPGISAEDRPHVFDRFYRSTDARAMPGSGLGLSIVRQIAERHAGTIAASRAQGGGACLTLRLPGKVRPD